MKRLTSTLGMRLLVLAIVGAGLTAGACREGEGTTSGCPSAEPAAPPIDPAVMAFLSAARALHHEADLKQRDGDSTGAVTALERLVVAPAPRAVEVDEVLADAHARLAELRLQRGDLAGAERDVQSGLGHVQGATYFRGHLLEVEGLVEETRASALADAGQPTEAAQARNKAMSLLEEAVHVQQQVIEHALADGGGR
jgi:hypothetical protein